MPRQALPLDWLTWQPDAARWAFSILGGMEIDSCKIVALATRPAGPWSLPLLVLALTLPVVAILWRTWPRLRETTLVVPLGWTAVSFAGSALMTLWAATIGTRSPESDFAAWQLVLACGTLCPLVAVIGAKRPQHGAWNLVVLTLWGMLALPAAEVLLLQPGQALEINSFRSWFLVALLLAELVNYGATRFGFAVLLLVAAQVSWLLPHLPWGLSAGDAAAQPVARQLIGFVLLTAAILVAWGQGHARREASSAFDRLWFDFRDAFGLFWALRLMERVNDAARQAEWDFDLGWTGFRTKTDFAPLGKLPTEISGPLRNALQGLLRRFVTTEWIEQRLDSPAGQHHNDSTSSGATS